MAESRGPEKQPLKHAQVAEFLAQVHDRSVQHLERLGSGFWSSAWGYQSNGEELVVRFGGDESWYEIDRMAMAFNGPCLPVPTVRDVGIAPDGRAFAISERHRGVFLEDIPPGQAHALAPTLTCLLVALHDVPADPGASVLWHSPGASPPSWRKFLVAGLVDDPDRAVHGWSATLYSDPRLSLLSSGVTEKISALADAVPERRDLVHGDLLHGNVLVSPDARQIEAVFSWKCSVRGDFLYDAAWCSFWAPWHEGIAATDPLAGVLAAPTVQCQPGALVDAADRHHCYELQIGFTHLGWNIWTRNQTDLDATANRLAEVLERGPLPLLGVPHARL